MSPFVHFFVWGVYAHWIGGTLLALTIAGAVLLAVGINDKSGRATIGAVMLVVFGCLWAVGVFMNSAWKHQAYLAHTPVNHISDEPDTTGFRFLPLSVAKTTATNKISDSTVSPGEPEPFVEGDEAKWIVPREPNNFNGSVFGTQPGFLTVNTVADTQADTTSYDPGFGLCCWSDWITWAAIEKHFWGDFSSADAYATNLNGETVIVKPYLTRRFDWSHLLPVMYSEWDGDIIFHHDGAIEDLSAAEAPSKYPGARLYPLEMAKYFSESYPYKEGWWNVSRFGQHINQPDVPHLGGDDKNVNQFPFLIPTEDGPVWYTAVEPYGSAKSAYMSYYVDATSGKVSVYEFPEPLVGPDRAESFVNNAFNQLKSTSFVEPRPFVKNGNLYWMVSATTSGSPDVQFTALVDAYSEDVIKLPSKQAVERVVAGEDPHKVGEVVSASASSAATDSGEDQESTMSDADLARLLREAADRLEKKG